MKIDLLSPASFAAGQPHDQYRWLREHAPVRWPGSRRLRAEARAKSWGSAMAN